MLFFQEELLKNFDAACVYVISRVVPKGVQTLTAIVMVKFTSSPKNLWRIQGHWAGGFAKARDQLCEEVCCRGLDSRLDKCMQRKVKVK